MVASPSSEPMVDFEFYNKQETIGQFERILPYFRRDLATTHNVIVKSTAAQLSSFTAKFQQFQYRTLGNPSVIQATRSSSSTTNKKTKSSPTTNNDNNNKPYPPCLPPGLFRTDKLTPLSPLYIILKTAYAYQPDDTLWDLDSHRRRNEYLELIHTMYERLEEANLYHPPRLALIGLTDQDKEKKEQLISMVNDLKGQMVDDINQATHILHFQKNDEKDDAKRVTSKMVHILESDNGNALVHWYRYPDSYNEWLNEKKIKDNKRFEGSGQQEDASAHGGDGPFYLQSSWLTDSYKFNSWMAPQDYLCPTSVITGLKRQWEGTLSNTDQGDDYDSDDNNKRSRTSKNGDDKTTTDIQEQARRYLSTQQFEVIIPSYAAWFEFDRVHQNERQALPEFFNGANQTKSPVTYVNFRNFMVNTYRLNPLEYLTVTACRRNLAGDVCAIIRIHAFLEKWGLINYQIDPTLKMSNIGPPFAGNFDIVMDMPKSLRPVQQSHPTTTEKSPIDLSSTSDDSTLNATRPSEETINSTTNDEGASTIRSTKKIDLNLELRQSVYPLVTVSNKQQSQSNTINSDNNNISNGNHVESSPTRSTESERNDTKETNELTDQQKVLLLEGMEMFENDWDAVAQHVGLSRDDCISHYLHLPLEDPYIDLDVMQSGINCFANRQQDKKRYDNDPLVLVVDFLKENANSDKVMAHLQTTTSNRNMDMDRDQITNDNNNDTKLAHDLIKTKVALYKNKINQFMELEAQIERERQLLEQERHQLDMDRLEIYKKTLQITDEMHKRTTMNGSTFINNTKDGTNSSPQGSIAHTKSSSPLSSSSLSIAEQERKASMVTSALASVMATSSTLDTKLL
ncbi:SWIRM domain-containing protein [Chlamydoabsidia padenii]|nr:SWIRM domain-containing protein [Chlamydoabsidia padenii]